MLFANDSNGSRVYIDMAKIGQSYFCPVCDGALVCKFGNIRQHHFAHASNSSCRDSWNYDEMSEWHQTWQSFFPEENQEVVFSYNGEKHRADVAIKNIIIEFQHSAISADEFLDRNEFYHSLGKKIIWIFDVDGKYSDDYEDSPSSIEPSLLSAIKTRSSIFYEKTIRDSADMIFFCNSYPPREREYEEQLFNLEQVSWIWNNPRSKTEIVYGVDNWYDNKDFVDRMLGKDIPEKNPKFGTIPYLWRKNKIAKWGIFQDEKGFKVRITSDPIATYEKYGQLYGCFAAPGRFNFNQESKRVAGMDQWELLSYE